MYQNKANDRLVARNSTQEKLQIQYINTGKQKWKKAHHKNQAFSPTSIGAKKVHFQPTEERQKEKNHGK